MPWNRTIRKDYKRDGRRYESDVTDKEWAIIEAMLPKQGPLGRPRETDLREVFNAIQYVLATGCQHYQHQTGNQHKHNPYILNPRRFINITHIRLLFSRTPAP